MFWSVRPVTCIGCGSLFNSLVRSVGNWSLNVHALNLSSSLDFPIDLNTVSVIDRKPTEITGCEGFLKRTSILYFVFPYSFLVNCEFDLYGFIARVLGSANDRRVRIVFGIYLNGSSVEGFNLIDFFRYCCEVSVNPIVFLLFDEVYGPGVDCGYIFEILKLFKVNPLNVDIPFNAEDIREYIYVDDAVHAFAEAVAGGIEGSDAMYWIPGSRISISGIVRAVMALLGVAGIGEVKFAQMTSSSSFRAADLWGCKIAEWFRPHINFIDGLKDTIDWFEVEYGPILVCGGANS